jgi:hypothetical protein
MAVAEKPLYYLSIHEAQQLIKDRKLSPVELTQSVLDRIAAVDDKLHAYIHLMADSAMAEARAAETEIQNGKWRGPMHGIPVAVKDQLDVNGAPARIRQFTKGVGDATAVRKLREAACRTAACPCRVIRGTPITLPAARAPAPGLRWRVACASARWVKTPPARFAIRRRFAASLD